MDAMYGIYFAQVQNRFVQVLPNGVKLAEFIVPNDGREDFDFDAVHNVCILLAERVGFLETKLSKLKSLKLPKEMRVVAEPTCYRIYINQNILIGVVYLQRSAISAKTVVGICMVLCKRWNDYIKKLNNSYKIESSQYFK